MNEHQRRVNNLMHLSAEVGQMMTMAGMAPQQVAETLTELLMTHLSKHFKPEVLEDKSTLATITAIVLSSFRVFMGAIEKLSENQLQEMVKLATEDE